MRRSIAITNEHGSWVFLFSPLLVGIFAGGRWSMPLLYLTIGALAGFLVRHPIMIVVKIYSGRRSRRDLKAALLWIAIYSLIGLTMVAGLILRGYGYVLYLAIPGVLVFIWHLWLVSRRAERRQAGVEIVAAGMLALSAPAAYWVGIGGLSSIGWILWLLLWLQSAASIVYAYLRLDQRQWKTMLDKKTRLRAGWRSILYTSFNLGFSVVLSIWGWISPWVFLPYLLQWMETLWGTLNPAIGVKPAKIGLRQLAVSSLFTILFILAW